MQQKQLKPVNNVIKGLVTEASVMSFPEGASVDELNCDLERSGVRRRRRGFVQEAGGGLSSFTKLDNDWAFHTEVWDNAGGVADLNFQVVQNGLTLYFFDLSAIPISSGEKAFTVNLTDFTANNSVPIETQPFQSDVVNGLLVITHPALDAFCIEYNSDADTITTTKIDIQVRDFDWQGDTSTYFTEEAAPPFERIYDTYNSGWVAEVVKAYSVNGGTAASVSTGNEEDIETINLIKKDVHPPLTHPWFSGKDSAGNYSTAAWKKISSQTSLLANGRFIYNFFRKSRGAKVGFPGYTEIENARFRCVASFAGRIWYAGLESSKNSGRILFSQIVTSKQDLGRCYQQADPTSEEDPDLVDSDGGVIVIPEAQNIKALFVFSTYLVVFAENGVWTVNGVDGVFKATEYSVSLRTRVGIDSPRSLVSADGVPLWWSKEGIHTLSPGNDLNLVESNISVGVIQTFFDSISPVAKRSAVGIFDRTNKVICWMYPNASETIAGKYNNFLMLNLTLEAFYPWNLLDKPENTDYIIGGFYSTGVGAQEVETAVLVGSNEVFVNTDSVVVKSNVLTEATRPGFVFNYKNGATDRMGFGSFISETFLDFESVDYLSFAEAGYDFQGSASLRGNAPYVTCLYNRTEMGYVGNDDIGYEFDKPSSCLLSVYWDQRTRPSTSKIQTYKTLRNPTVDSTDLTNFPAYQTTVITKNKVLGRGRVMRLRFESETGKDFQLIGYEVLSASNRQV